MPSSALPGLCAAQLPLDHRFDRFEAARRNASIGGCPHTLCPSAALYRAAPMAAQELEVSHRAGDLASQATAPSHALDSESLLSQPSVIVEAEPEAEADEPDDVFGDAETSDAPYVIPAFQEKQEPIEDADKKKWKVITPSGRRRKKTSCPSRSGSKTRRTRKNAKKSKICCYDGRCDLSVPSCCGGFTSSKRLVSISDEAIRTFSSLRPFGPRCSAQVRSRTRREAAELSSTRRPKARQLTPSS